MNNFCKISFFLKWLFTQKKHVFCIFHVLQLPPANQTTYITYVVKVGKNLAKSLTLFNFLFLLIGAGWGGCIVTLIPEDQTNTFIENMKNEYFQNCPAANGLNPSTYIFPTIPGQGAAVYNII